MRLFGLAAILAALAVPLVAEAQPPPLSGAHEPVVEATTIEVVPLTYARASELAYILAQVAPPRVRVVPYPPTNSLIISGPRRSVEELMSIIKPSDRGTH